MSDSNQSGGNRRSAARQPGVLRWASVVGVLGAATILSYYLLQVRGRERVLDHYHLRVLATACDNVADRIANQREQIVNVVVEAEKLARAAAAESATRPTRGVSDVFDETLAEKFALVSGGLEYLGSQLDERPPDDRGERIGEAHRLEAEVDRSGSIPVLRYALWNESSVAERPAFDLSLADGSAPRSDAALVPIYTAEAALDELIGTELPADVFESVFLARSEDQILLRRGESSLRLSALPETRAADGETPVDAAALASRTSAEQIEIAGRAYRLFTQPIPLPFAVHWQDEAEADAIWTLIGIRPLEVVRSDSLQVSSTFVIGSVFGLLLMFLGLPVVRLFSIGARDQVTPNDVLVLVISVVIGTALAALLLVDVPGYQSLRNTRDGDLAELAQRIDQAVTEESFALTAQLERLTAAAAERYPIEATAAEPKPVESTLRAGARASAVEATFAPIAASPLGFFVRSASIARTLTEDHRQAVATARRRTDLLAERDLFGPGSGAYPIFEMASWMGAGGAQLAKWTVRATTTPMGAFPQREYYSRSAADDVWTVPPPAGREDEGPKRFFIDSIRSKTQGGVLTVLSTPSSGVGPGGEPIEVACLATKLQSLIDPVIPDGFQFAVVKPDGLVAFHSDSDRNLGENLFEEFSAGDRLMASVAARSRDLFDTTYRAQEVRAHVRPMAIPDWSLVVFADKGPWRALHLEVLLFSFVLLGGLFLALAAGAGWLHVTTRGTPKRGSLHEVWYWPEVGRVEVYRALVRGLLALAVTWSVLLVLVDNPVSLVELGFAFPVLAFTLLHLILSPRQLSSTALARTHRYAVAGVSLLLLVRGWWNWFGDWEGVIGLTCLAVVLALRSRRAFSLVALVMIVTALLREPLAAMVGVLGLAVSAAFFAEAIRARTKPLTPTDREHWRSLEGAAWQTWGARRWHTQFAAVLFLLLTTLSALPAASFYSAGLEDLGQAAARERLLQLSRSLDERAERHRERFGSIEGAAAAGVADELSVDGRMPYDIHLPRRYELAVLDGDRLPSFDVDRRESWLAQLHALVPAGDYRSLLVRALRSDTDPEGLRWRTRSGGEEVDLYRPAPPPALGSEPDSEAGSDGAERAATDEREFLVLGTGTDRFRSVYALLSLPLATIVTALGFVATRSISSRLFVLERLSGDPVPEVVPKIDASGRLLLLRPQPDQAADLVHGEGAVAVEPARFRTELDPSAVSRELTAESPPRIVFTRFEEVMEDSDGRDRKLRLLEALLVSPAVANGSTDLVLISNLDPVYQIASRRREDPGSWTDDEFARWSELLESFDKVRNRRRSTERESALPAYRADLEAAAGLDPEAAGSDGDQVMRDTVDAIAEECWGTWRLQEIGSSLLDLADDRGLTQGEVVELVQDQAEAHYSRIWSECNHEERLTLHRLAGGAWVNWRSLDTLLRLRRRALIQASPELHLMNESFRRFVLTVENPEVYTVWAREGETSLWLRLRAPMTVGFLVVVAFFFITQRQAFNQTVGAIAALAAGAPALIRLAGLIPSPKSGDAKH